MHPGLALVAGQRGTLGDFPSLGSYFLERSTDLGVRFNGRSFGHGHYTQNDECSRYSYDKCAKRTESSTICFPNAIQNYH